MADADPKSVGYVEAHGTATPIGDPIEVTALRRVFENTTDETSDADSKQYCAIGSVKGNIGHTVAAAGVAGLIKVAMALHDEQIPATLHYENPNPQIDIENSPFYVCDSLTPWTRTESPRRGGVSSFGVGGTNAHILLEEAPADSIQTSDSVEDQSANELPVSILPVSGKTEEALAANVNNLVEHLNNGQGDLDSLVEAAQTLQLGRDEFIYLSLIHISEPTRPY